MMPQYNSEKRTSDREWVVSIYELSFLVTEGILSFNCSKGGLLYYQLIGKLEDIRLKFPNILHYLDHFLLILPDSVKEQQVFWERFYSFYSTEYLHMIDIEHNLSCMRYFRELLDECSNLPPNFKILDYGCGPGLSLDVFGYEHLVGYDNSPKMLEQAKARGLNVLSKKEFDSMSPCSVDGIIACYVLHMAIPENDIIKLAGLMKVGGVLVANYYKDLGLERVSLMLQKLGFSAQKVNDQERRFGSVYIYRKQALFSSLG